jgi:hypothetical protein
MGLFFYGFQVAAVKNIFRKWLNQVDLKLTIYSQKFCKLFFSVIKNSH